MQFLFVDESGTAPPPSKVRDAHFVIAGISIPDGAWASLRDGVFGMKIRRQLVGELKWRYFAPTNTDPKNPMRHMLPDERDEIRREVYSIITAHKSVKVIACVAHIESAYKLPHVQDADDLYHNTYKPVSERFQYHLQDLTQQVGRKENGIIVADHRGARQDERLREAHERLIRPGTIKTSRYENLIESLFFLPSDLSVGVQLADLAAGAIWRKFEKADDRWYELLEPALRKNSRGEANGFGVVRFPQKGW